MRNTKDGLRRATYIFEAAVWHYAIKAVCRCRHSATFNSASLWWRFERKGWDDHLGKARAHFWCRQCAFRTGQRVRPIRLEVVAATADDIAFQMPDEREWKRAIRRFRT